MIKTLIAAAITGAAFLSAGGAHSASLTFGFTHPLEITDIHQTGDLGLFDPSLGVLNSVVLSLDASNTTNLQLSNSATQGQLVRATVSTDLFFSSSLAGIDALLVNPVISLNATTGFVTIAPGATASFGPLNDASSVHPLPAASLFLGTGAFSISCYSSTGLNVQGGGGNVAVNQATQASCGATIAYDYTPAAPHRTSEPGTLALVGACVVGVGALRRRSSRPR